MSYLPTPSLTLLQPASIVLNLIAALDYSTATIGIKMGATTLSGLAILVMTIALAAAVFGEIAVVRGADLGPIYIAIIGGGSLIVMTYAWYIGKEMSLCQIGGAGIVVLGLALVNTQAQTLPRQALKTGLRFCPRCLTTKAQQPMETECP